MMLKPFRLALLLAIILLSHSFAAAGEVVQLFIKRAAIEKSDIPGMEVLALDLTDESRAVFADFTTRHVGKNVEISVDAEVVMAPRIMEPITGGKLNISGSFERSQMEAILARISSGDAKVEVATRDPE